jgi:GH24 family phage-related lysozyme (muramidase)
VATYLEQSLAKLKEFEGSVPWMYRDTVGKVTVGVGLMLPDAKAAQALPFMMGTRPATPAETAAEFARVNAMAMGHPAAFYKTPASVELTQQTIDAKLSSVLQGFETDLRTEFPHFDSLPDGVKMALLDMVYNLGPQGLFHGFPHLISAIQTGNWSLAADNCTRRGPAPSRNDWTRQQFLSAVVTTIRAEAESLPARILRRIRQTLNRVWNRVFGPVP